MKKFQYWRRKATSFGMCACPKCGQTAKRPVDGSAFYVHEERASIVKTIYRECRLAP